MASRVPVFYDFETTGVGSHARVVQFGAVCGQFAFCELVNPGVPIPAAATAVHKISDGMVANSLKFLEVWRAFLAFLERATDASALLLVGYNSWAYDDKLLHAELGRAGVAPEAAFGARDVWTADVMRAMREDRRSSGSKETLKLGDVYERLVGEALRDAHDALADCRATREVLARLTTPLEGGPFAEGCLPVDKRQKKALPAPRLGRLSTVKKCGCKRVVSRFFECACCKRSTVIDVSVW
jgi:DNA polymerase-3 subunit epsilon